MTAPLRGKVREGRKTANSKGRLRSFPDQKWCNAAIRKRKKKLGLNTHPAPGDLTRTPRRGKKAHLKGRLNSRFETLDINA